jgi:hypothetical protein
MSISRASASGILPLSLSFQLALAIALGSMKLWACFCSYRRLWQVVPVDFDSDVAAGASRRDARAGRVIGWLTPLAEFALFGAETSMLCRQSANRFPQTADAPGKGALGQSRRPTV